MTETKTPKTGNVYLQKLFNHAKELEAEAMTLANENKSLKEKLSFLENLVVEMGEEEDIKRMKEPGFKIVRAPPLPPLPTDSPSILPTAIGAAAIAGVLGLLRAKRKRAVAAVEEKTQEVHALVEAAV